MGRHGYSEEELLAKKYNDLFKISKALGIKTARKLKTDKLIEAILKCQREEVAEAALAQDAEAVVEALGGGTQEKEEEEMLLDVPFPECGSQDPFDSLSDTTQTSKASEAHTGPGTSKSATPAKRHKRSGTYDVEEEEDEEEQVKAKKREQEKEAETSKQQEEQEKAEKQKQEVEQEQKVKKMELVQGAEKRKQEEKREEEEEEEEEKRGRKKRQRSSTFELSSSNDVTLPIDEKETEDNSKQLSQLLVSKVTVRGSRQHGTTADKGKDKRKATTRLSLTPAAKRRRESVTITPSAPAPALRPSRKSRGTPIGSPALTKATPAATTSTAAVAPKPVFNIGRGDNKVTEGDSQEDKQGGKGATSGIPRFLSYARRLKVPNFARIHNQAFQRMEGLDDYVDKRKARKDTLSSTAKKQQPKAKVFQPSVTSVKSLNFDFSAGSSEDCSINDGVLPVAPSPSKPLSAVPLRPSPKSARRASTNIASGARVPQRATRHSVKPGKPQVSFTKPNMTRKSPRVVSNASPKNTKEVSPKATKKASPKAIPGHKGSPQTGQKSQIGQGSRSSLRPVSSKKVSTVGVPVFGFQLKENQKPGKQSLSNPMVGKLARPSEVASPTSVRKRMQDYSQSLASRGTGYVPYKGAVKPLKDRSDLKNLAQRKHKVKSSKEIREGQRGILKGVRLNKRFELQMANRGIAL